MLAKRVWAGRALAATVAVLTLNACSDSITEPTTSQARRPNLATGSDARGVTTACRVGPAGGDYQFTVSKWDDHVGDLEGLNGQVTVPVPFALAAGECKDVYLGTSENADGLYIREAVMPAGSSLDSITITKKGWHCENPGTDWDLHCPQKVLGTDQAYVDVNINDAWTITFYDSRLTPEPGPKDSDLDGIMDTADNCPAVKNKNQYDFDRDGLGTACDPSFNLWFAPLMVDYVCGNVFRVLNNRVTDGVSVTYTVSGKSGSKSLTVKGSDRDRWFNVVYFDAGSNGTVTLKERGFTVGSAKNRGVRSCPARVLAKVGR